MDARIVIGLALGIILAFSIGNSVFAQTPANTPTAQVGDLGHYVFADNVNLKFLLQQINASKTREAFLVNYT
ncbi:MAG: hypothetical protein AABY11_00615 [archaeon]